MPAHRLGEGPYGSAYQGTIDDLVASGDLRPLRSKDRTFGLFLGHFDWQQSVRHAWTQRAKGLSAWLAQDEVSYSRLETVPQVQDLRFTGDQHHLIVASTGSGKFRDALSNMLLFDGSCETACLIIDPKGEIASITGPFLDPPGADDPRTIILDPWNVTGTGHTDALTLLDGIHAGNPHCVRDARVLAEAIIVERSGDDGHWTATARSFLAALLLYLCLDKLEKGHRHLLRLRQIVTTSPWDKFADLLAYLKQSDLCEGLVSRAAKGMLNRDLKERRAILSTLERDTAFIEDPNLWKAITTSSFNMNELVVSNKRLHVIVPFDYTDQMKSWLRLSIAAFYNACLRHHLPSNLPRYLQFRHIVIDEFAGLGRLDFILKGIAEARGAGMKFHLAIQDFGQLRALYGDGWESLVSNSFLQAFGINDVFTAEYLSKMTGQATVVTTSTGVSSSYTEGTSYASGRTSSTSFGQSHSSSSGTTSNTTQSSSRTTGSSTTFSSTGRPVLMPDEIRRLSDHQQLLFLRGMPVFLTRRTPYYITFQRYLPRHSLRDVLIRSRRSRSLRSLSAQQIGTAGPLRGANSSPNWPKFKPPPRLHYTFWDAFGQSPGVLAFVVGVFFFSLWLVPYQITSMIQAHHQEAIQREMAAHDSAIAAEARKEAEAREEAKRKAEAELERQAAAIDARVAIGYAPLATAVAHSLTHLGLCAAGSSNDPNFSCNAVEDYADGALAPIQIDLNAHRKLFAKLEVVPLNELRNDARSGARADVEVSSVFDHVDLADEARVPPALRLALSAMLRAFQVPDQVATSCMTQGTQLQVNGAYVLCHFDPRPPDEGGLAKFALTLERPM